MQSQLPDGGRGEGEPGINRQIVFLICLYRTRQVALNNWYTRRRVTMLGNWIFRYFLIKILSEENVILKPS